MRAAAIALLLFPALVLAADTDLVINEVFYVGAVNEDWIELKNTGADSIDVENWWVCARFAYSQLAPLPRLDGDDWILAPNEILTVGFGLNDASSDLGIYSAPAFADSGSMVDFVQWGTDTDPGRADVAALKGIWTQTGVRTYDFVPTAAAGESTAFDGSNGGGGLLTLSTDFGNGVPTRGQENESNSPVTPTSWGRVKSLYR